MQIKCCPDAYHDFRLKFVTIFRHKSFLLWSAQPNPENIRLALGNELEQISLLLIA